MAAELTIPRHPIVARRRKVVLKQPNLRLHHLLVSILPLIQVGLFLLAVSFTIVLGIVGSSYRDFSRLIDQQIAGGYLKSHAGLYAAPRVIEKGARLTKDELALRLQRAGYATTQISNIWNGSFETNDNEIRIVPRQGAGSYESINVKFDKRGNVAALTASNGAELQSYSLEPELLTADAALKTGVQQTLTFQDIPPVVVQAILSIEDRRFFDHKGVDGWGIARAIVSNSSQGKVRFRQGGSTITQQLVKNVYLSPEKTLRRKFNEAVIAVALENRLSKQDIFALYCNEVYLGQRNGVGVRGVAQAARVFFGKELKELSVSEAATLAGMIQSPARYAPDRHAEQARTRRDLVITAMVRDGAISQDQGQLAQAVPVEVASFESAGNAMAPYYVDSVNRALEASSSHLESEIDQPLRVQTTIDPDLQAAAEQALQHQLDALDKVSKANAKPQGAMVVLDPHTGQVLAMVGGRNYAESQLNRATDGKRQPGSVFKPIVYAAALEAGISPLSIYNDAPRTFQYGNATYSPDNFGKSYSMHDVLMREGLIRSLNVVTVELAMRVGLARVANTAARFGLPRPPSYPAMALGTTEVTPLQVAVAYAAFVNGGKLVQPTVVEGVIDDEAERSGPASHPSTQIIKPTTAYMITNMLSDVTGRGTAQRAKSSFQKLAIAGKTGTSRDGWFVGYTPNLVCAVWIGYDDNKQLGLTGAEAALPAWIEFMKEALAVRPSLGGASFIKPGGITTVRVDPETGFLAGPHCPSGEVVSVASQMAPVAECYKHRAELEEMPSIDESGLEYLDVSPAIEAEVDARTQGSAIQPSETDVTAEESKTRPASRPTQNEVSRTGQPILVNDPLPAGNSTFSNPKKHR